MPFYRFPGTVASKLERQYRQVEETLMKAMVLEEIGAPLRLTERPDPLPGKGELMLRVEACAVCRTDLHVVDGELPNPKLPVVPGHEIVGIVEAVGEGIDPSRIGQRVGVP